MARLGLGWVRAKGQGLQSHPAASFPEMPQVVGLPALGVPCSVEEELLLMGVTSTSAALPLCPDLRRPREDILFGPGLEMKLRGTKRGWGRSMALGNVNAKEHPPRVTRVPFGALLGISYKSTRGQSRGEGSQDGKERSWESTQVPAASGSSPGAPQLRLHLAGGVLLPRALSFLSCKMGRITPTS